MTLHRFVFYIFLLTLVSSLKAQGNGEYTLPSNFRDADCTFLMNGFEMSIAEKYRSTETDVSTYYPAVTGDINGDGFSEIVIPGGTHNASQYVYIFSHKAELIKRIVLPDGVRMMLDYDSVVLADLDNDGKAEIIVTATNGYRLLIYDNEGSLLAQTNHPTSFAKITGVADFDKDGIPEIYSGTRIYHFDRVAGVRLIADAGNEFFEETVAQDVTGDGFLDLVSVNTVYKVEINSLTNLTQNTIEAKTICGDINTPNVTTLYKTFALADVDLDGVVDVVTVVPVRVDNTNFKLIVRIWNTLTGRVDYDLDIAINSPAEGRSIKNSWPFIGDTDGNGFPDIIFMGGINLQGYTSVYRLEYDAAAGNVVERKRNNRFNDYSSMCTSMSMFDFNNDGKYEIVYRDQSSLYILNGETLEVEQEVTDCNSGTGWEYPIIASLTPDNESFIVMPSGTATNATTGSLRIYGANTAEGAHPWMPARKVWNQYAFYQNLINENLSIISNPAPLDYTLTSADNNRRLQPFNGHMLQLGVINPMSLESIYPVTDIAAAESDFGYNRAEDKLILDFKMSNSGEIDVDSDILLKIYSEAKGEETLVSTYTISQGLNAGVVKPIRLEIEKFSDYMPFDKLYIRIAQDIPDCDYQNNEFTILSGDLSNVYFVKKGETGTGKSWADAMGELSDALAKARQRNDKYPNSIAQIWVAQGSYFGNFVMQEGVNVYGGFSGVETSINQSRPLDYPTILDAGGAGRVLTQESVFQQSTEWRGFILQNGKTEKCGGGALLQRGSVLSYSVIRDNTASQGAGICSNNSTVVNCVVEANRVEGSVSAQGAGIFAVNHSVIVNNTVVKNKNISASFAQGAGIYSLGSTVFNNIIYGNTTNSISDNLYALESLTGANFTDPADAIDPLFTDYEEGDYQLLPISPALNKGENQAVAGWAQDIQGTNRIYADVVDQGAFEYQGKELSLAKDGSFFVNEKKEGNGANWENAVNNLSDALTGAKLINDAKPNTVKQIWVASGTYAGVFEMVEGANLHGGFAGNETDFNQMDTVANKTYIDAMNEGRVLTQSTDFEVPTEWGGVILQNGCESGIDKDVYGGGAYLKKNGALRYSTIRNSQAVAISNYNKVNAYGGGVYLEEGASLTRVTVEGNITEIIDNSEGAIPNGVAQGGGVNSVKNRLTYLVVKGNKNISQTNTDGGAIYSSGDIINSMVDENIGRSAIYIQSGAAVVNNTIISNRGEYTIYGETGGKLQNSIVYGNEVSRSDFYNIEEKGNNNLVNTDPLFREGGFRLQYGSPARAMGNPSFFPSDLDEDMSTDSRFIYLKDNVKIIDAGVYQSDIKIVSATEKTIEVPFGTTFEKLGLKNSISGLLEFGYGFESAIAWEKGAYDALAAGEYTLSGNLNNFGERIINPDNVQGTIKVIVKKNHIADIEGLHIADEDWLDRLDEQYIIDCDYSSATIPVTIDLPYFATVSFSPEVEFIRDGNRIIADLNINKPGTYKLEATVTSQDGEIQKVYPLVIVKYFPFWSIIEQRWNNTLVVNNNKETNGGYEFVSYTWYRDDKEIGTKQYYSAGSKKTDLLSEQSLYYAKMIDINGLEYSTCKDSPVLMNYGIQVTPNPVKIGDRISIKVPLKKGMKGAVSVYSLSGLTVVTNEPLTGELTEIDAPANPGIYILRISLEGGVSESLRIVVY